MRSLEFSNASTPVNAVTNSSSFTSVFLSTAFIARLPASIIDSCTPPKCGACGGCLWRVEVPYDSSACGVFSNFTLIHPVDRLSQLPFCGDEICSIIGNISLRSTLWLTILWKAFKKVSKSYPKAISI